MTLAEQLMDAERSTDAACIAVMAAKKLESRREIDAAQKAYIRAHSMDRTNSDASIAIVGICANTSRRCEELEKKNAEMETNFQTLRREVDNLKDILYNRVQWKE